MALISVIVPVYDEEENVEPLYRAVDHALSGRDFDFELVLVDDGSKDRTYERAAALVERDPRVRVVKFRRNYGQTAAMAAGVEVARGDVLVTMDGDLQNDPEDIPRLLERIEEGYDIAIGWRRKRKDGGARVFISKIANRIMTYIMGIAVRDSGCSLKAYRAELIKGIPMYGEMHRFIPALSQLAGARLVELEVNHRPRQFGVSKYGFSRIQKVMLDIVTIRVLLSYARAPLTWHLKVVGLSLLLDLLAFGYVIFGQPKSLVVAGGIAMVLFSLTLFLVVWGLAGGLFAAVEPNVGRYAVIAAKLSSRLKLLNPAPQEEL
ncbi:MULTISPECIES: glycosyltransferase family 2 protein [Novosphingobium]|uniref:Glycosyltransferase involved in cell wall bisynthesis n=1 Tax=Novosphingobium mathurense TaxID=428990 RepID=A0A1U6IBX2_9SPHN|nr:MULTISPECIES: glycosyltransferase family 2 protein [Novosphingobium]CDO35692.1 Glycosyl transferase, family 2 [Novosphingobium sp. KN65.2]SLK05504.1 Glycosyltransferase involved in cell wall bisynthesis [Novosphingobium mathurense]